MLNQTNIGANNNKFYVVQALSHGGKFYAYTRWGRVVSEPTREEGLSSLRKKSNSTCREKRVQIKCSVRSPRPMRQSNNSRANSRTKPKITVSLKFCSTWKSNRCRSVGDDRASFKKVSGKYDLIDVAGDGDDEEEEASTTSKSTTVQDKDGVVYAASKLDSATQSLIRLIFDTDMFKDALRTYDIDVKKMPLGKLSKGQIAKGFEILEELEAVMENKKKGTYTELSSQFYTCIPHDFGRQRPRPIDTREALQQKYDMLAVSPPLLCSVESMRSIDSRRSSLISNWRKVFRRTKTKTLRRRKRNKRNHIRTTSITVYWNAV